MYSFFHRSRAQPGMINIFANIVKQDQITGLWRGMVPVSFYIFSRCNWGMFSKCLRFLLLINCSRLPDASQESGCTSRLFIF